MFARLAVAMRLRPPDAVMMSVYYEALRQIPLSQIQEAAARWTQTGKWFPTTGQWAELARACGRAKEGVWRPVRKVACEACQDTGWRYHDCTAGQRCGQERCLDRGPEWAHVFVRRCPCFTSEVATP